jgi:Arc/MetJ-type ribon-helix-helix transcriptional regulator
MNLRLKPETETWLKEQVARGRFGSLDEAVETLVNEDRIAQTELDSADLTWAKPYLSKGLADIEAGHTLAGEDVHAELRSRSRRSRES